MLVQLVGMSLLKSCDLFFGIKELRFDEIKHLGRWHPSV
uniref:Uncharacterized protein n=1 Tax=Tetranychus urticae TaxID=32264 RepID=T1K9D3_TETUR